MKLIGIYGMVIILSVVSCATTSQLASLKHFDEASLVLQETYPDDADDVLSLDDTLAEGLDNSAFPLTRLILTVKHDNTTVYDVSKDNRNEESYFLERHLFQVLKQVQGDLSIDANLYMDFDDVLLESENEEERKLGPIRPDVFNWEGLSLSDNEYVDFLVSNWNNISIPNDSRQEAVFIMSISFINEKNFVGYKVHISLIVYNTIGRIPQKYTINYSYTLQ